METMNEKTASSDKADILKKYTRQPYPALVKPEPAEAEESEENGYRALVEHREKKGNSPRFRIIDRKGVIYGCGYAYLLGWLYSPPETLSIYTTTHSFILTGRGLDKIEAALMREKVKQLREFHLSQDDMPGLGEPLIERLEISSRFE